MKAYWLFRSSRLNTETITFQNVVPKHLPSAFILLTRQGSVISEAHGLIIKMIVPTLPQLPVWLWRVSLVSWGHGHLIHKIDNHVNKGHWENAMRWENCIHSASGNHDHYCYIIVSFFPSLWCLLVIYFFLICTYI